LNGGEFGGVDVDEDDERIVIVVECDDDDDGGSGGWGGKGGRLGEGLLKLDVFVSCFCCCCCCKSKSLWGDIMRLSVVNEPTSSCNELGNELHRLDFVIALTAPPSSPLLSLVL